MNDLQKRFTKETLARLDALSLSLKHRLGNDGYAGARKSNAKGNSLEFSDFREYVPGDDLRRVDWNSYARFGKIYMKLYMEEKQAAVHIFLDSSLSMAGEEKFLHAKEFAASLAYLTLANTDRVALYAFSEGKTEEKTGLMHPGKFTEVLEFLDRVPAKGKTDLTRTFREVGRLRRGISVIISDFLAEEDWETAVKYLQYQKQEVFLIQVLSEEELNPTMEGTIRLVDCETGEARDLEIDATVLESYRQALKEQEVQLKEICRRRSAVYLRSGEKEPVLKGMQKLLYGQ